ncbi:unnamed protein product [Adineta steineri]|uniref:Uncharacterized protein n=1 Tax=Adineta steineri TaxID=433720 RepID=A0A815EXL0_9BILA|nr:unnamed protein product [Adineta steineri]
MQQTANCNLMTQDNGFFDITHTFKVGSSMYHVLGLRKDRPTYKNTYYIFNCTNDQHESTNDFSAKSLLFKRRTRPSEQISPPKQRPLTAHHKKTISIDDSITNNKNKIQKSKSTSSHPRARSASPKKVETDTATMKEMFTTAIRTERQLMVAQLRKEMNIKKKALLRSIKQEKKVLLQATTEANKKDELIHLLEEQNNTLTNAYEQFATTTTSSIDTLKQTITDMLNTQYTTSQSAEKIQLALIQTIEKEVQKIVSKNEEILKSTSNEINAINKLQDTLIQKIENYSTEKESINDTTLNRLFAEQKQALNDVVIQQQQTHSFDIIKQAMIDAFQHQQITSVNNTEHLQQQTNNNITHLSSQDIQINNKAISNNTNDSLFKLETNQIVTQSLSKLDLKRAADQHLFKVSIRTPESVHLYAKLVIDGMEYSRRLHTLCQRDVLQHDLFNCYIAPPVKDGPYEVTIYAKTHKDTMYRAAICIRLPGSNIAQSNTLPMIHQSFEDHQCILMEPLRRFLRQNEYILIRMIVPNALTVKIRNGDDLIELDVNEYKKGVVKKKIRVRGDVCVIGCWDKKIDSTICVFNMV